MAQNSVWSRIKTAYGVLAGNPQPNAQKGIFGNTYSTPLFGGYAGLDASNRDLTYNEYGAAQASQLLVDISASLAVWEQFLDGITWHIKDVSTGTTIASSDTRVLDPSARGSRFFQMVRNYQTRAYHSYWKSIAVSDWVAGETYVYRVPNNFGYASGLQWLNPLATEPQITNGKIDYYQYYNDDSADVGYRIEPAYMAYRMLRRDLFQDLSGFSSILTVIDESNLSRNVKRAFRGYFRNGMILGGFVSPADNKEFWSNVDKQNIESQLRINNKGTDNAHSWIISPRAMNIQEFDGKDASRDIEVMSTLSGYIHKALKVPEVLTGTVADATYENLSASEYQFYRMSGIPYAKEIATFHNDHIMPYVDKGVYLEPELTKYESERPETVTQDVSAGLIDVFTAQIKRGETKPDERLKDIYIINNRPMHIDIINELAHTMPANEIAERASAVESISDASSQDMQAASDDLVTQDSPPSPENDDTSYSTQSSILGAKDAPENTTFDSVTYNGVTVQASPVRPSSRDDKKYMRYVRYEGDERLIHWGQPGEQMERDNDDARADFNARHKCDTKKDPFSAGFWACWAWQPSADVGNKSLDLITISHGDHTHEVAIKAFSPAHDTREDELKAWYKVAGKSLARAKSFEPVWLHGDIADELHDSLSALDDTSKSALDAVFDPLFERVRTKAIQATRLDYEFDITTLLERARDDNNFGRVQWASAMRTIIRRYSRLAYQDGLVDGGVMDGVLDSDDETQLRDHIRAQSQYVTNLGEKIFKDDSFTLTDADIQNKPAMWWNKSVNPSYQLGLASADANSMYEWVYGATEHCVDCQRLNGQRHRLKSWHNRGLLPQSDILACNGFNCKCRLVKTFAKARGRF